MKNYNKVIAAVVAGIVCSAVTSQAALSTITPGNGVVGTGTSVLGIGDGGGSIYDFLSSNYSYNGNQGTITTTVYSNDSNNPLLGLTFVYALTVTAGDITTVALNDFGSVASVAVGYGASSGLIPALENFSTSGVVNFSWLNNVTSANGVQYLVVGTSINADSVGGVEFVDGGNFPTLTPILVPVPEPATVVAGALLLLPLGIGAVRSLRKERVA